MDPSHGKREGFFLPMSLLPPPPVKSHLHDRKGGKVKKKSTCVSKPLGDPLITGPLENNIARMFFHSTKKKFMWDALSLRYIAAVCAILNLPPIPHLSGGGGGGTKK